MNGMAVNVLTGDTLQGDQGAYLDELGKLSAEAQGLKEAITSAAKLRKHPEQEVWVISEPSEMLAFLRVGVKHLYLVNGAGSMTESDPLCVLDFYVHHSRQRSGIGAQLFLHMLQSKGVKPQALAYDRPSPKLPPFLQKHFGLSSGLTQPNRFMVFPEYFTAKR